MVKAPIPTGLLPFSSSLLLLSPPLYIPIVHEKVNRQHIDDQDQHRSNHDRIQFHDHNDNALSLNEVLTYTNEIT